MNPHGLIQVCSLHHNLKNLQPGPGTCFRKKKIKYEYRHFHHSAIKEPGTQRAGRLEKVFSAHHNLHLLQEVSAPSRSIRGCLGWSGVGSVSSLLSPASHYVTAHCTCWTIISIAKCFPSSSCLLHWKLDGGFCCPRKAVFHWDPRVISQSLKCLEE